MPDLKTWEKYFFRVDFSKADSIELRERGALSEGAPPDERTIIIEDGTPSGIDPIAVRNINITVSVLSQRKVIPKMVRRFTQLTHLSLPSSLIENLKPGDLPDSLKSIYIYDSDCVMPSSVFFPSLEWLAASGMCVQFDPKMMPSLKNLSTNLDKPGKTWKCISSISSLVSLTAGPISDAKSLKEIAHLNLEYLGVSPRRSVRTLIGLEDHHNLHYIRLANFNDLEDLDPVVHLANLREIFIQNCKRLPSLEPLKHLQSLQKITLLRCGALHWGAVRESFMERGVIIDDKFT